MCEQFVIKIVFTLNLFLNSGIVIKLNEIKITDKETRIYAICMYVSA